MTTATATATTLAQVVATATGTKELGELAKRTYGKRPRGGLPFNS
jgi:hypothetical protein